MSKLVLNNPKNAKAHYLRARFLVAVGKGPEAGKEADLAVQVPPTIPITSGWRPSQSGPAEAGQGAKAR